MGLSLGLAHFMGIGKYVIGNSLGMVLAKIPNSSHPSLEQRNLDKHRAIKPMFTKLDQIKYTEYLFVYVGPIPWLVGIVDLSSIIVDLGSNIFVC